MKNLNEFLSTKINNKFLEINEIGGYIKQVAMKVFHENEEGSEIIKDKMMSFIEKHNLDGDFRVYGNNKESNDFILKNKTSKCAQPFFNAIKDEFLLYDIFDSVTNGDLFDADDFDTGNSLYEIYSSKFGIMLMDQDTDNGIMFELIDKNITDINPFLYKYYSSDHKKSLLEISSRRLLDELKDVPYSSDWFWQNYTEILKDYKQLAEDKTDLEFFLCGRNGKHVCIEISFKAIHFLEKIKEIVNDLQEKLKKDLQDEVDYQNSEDSK